jgi:hypothetical protein
MARETVGLIDLWQIDNEMDIDVFKGPLSIEQSARLLISGARGIKKGNPAAKTSINPAFLGDNSIYLYKTLYSGSQDLFDYAGIDGYFGSWQQGGPRSWIGVIDKIYELTGKPVLIHEWGYSAVDREPEEDGSGHNLNDVCYHGWFNVWKNSHSEDEQAEYIKEAMKIFAEHPHVAGNFFFMWGDPKSCFHCGQPGCPAECGWGLMDINGRLRKAYYTLQDTIKKYYK